MNSHCTARTWLAVVLVLAAVRLSTTGLLDWARSDSPQVNIPWLPLENETRCYEELGCLNVTRDWYHLIYRPFNVFPLPRDVINTRFVLYTRKNLNEGQLLRVQNEETILKSNFNPKKQTKVIIHGFIDTPLSNWVKDMRKELLKHADWNVVVVDWAGGSLPLYTQATANTRLVGLELAYFINYLQKNLSLDPADVHMIGHSLGAHTAGYAGERIHGLGRITGLDPAEPYFQGMPSFVRLDPSDAKLVDVIHTDGKSIFLLEVAFDLEFGGATLVNVYIYTIPGLKFSPYCLKLGGSPSKYRAMIAPGYGMRQPCGHVDFYPNNGKEQPGCDLTETPLPLTLIRDGIEEASRVLVACNHIRAIKLFIDSINSECPYVAHRCDSYQHFLQGRCFSCQGSNASECAMMGLQTDAMLNNAISGDITPGGKYFISTGKDFPFCRHHYKVTVELAKPPKAENWVQGFMRISLLSDSGEIQNLDLTPSGYVRLQHGQSRSFVVTHSAHAGKIRKVEFYWEYDMDVLQPRSLCILWCNDHLYVSKIQVEEMGMSSRGKRAAHEMTSQLCTPGNREYADIASRSSASFYDNCP